MNVSPAIILAEGVEINIPKELELISISFSEGIFDDITIHDFLIGEVLPKNPTALIIPASLGTIQTDYWGFRIGMHLRLTKTLGALRFIPLIFVSDDSLEEILVAQNEKLAVLCSTPGSILVSNDENDINTALRISNSIDLVNYKNKFLKAITINRPDSSGKHSLANVWGVSRLAKATGMQEVLLGREDIANRYKELYVKYLQSVNDADDTSEAEFPLPALVEIKAESSQILLIDDEADKGWADVLKPIFKGNLACISGESKSFDEFYDEAKTSVSKPIWDLILLDLRLDSNEDQAGNEYKMAKHYSGAKLLTYIKQQNPGNQVIIFTASNKAWNMQQLLDMRADGYYVKESPEFDQSTAFSVLTFNSFAERVNVCLEKNYLREAWRLCESIKKLLRIVDTKLIRSPHGIVLYLEQGFSSLCQADSRKTEFFVYAFLDFYKIIETLSKELIIKDVDGIYIKGKASRGRYDKISFITFIPNLISEITPTQLPDKSIANFQIQAFQPLNDDTRYYVSPTTLTLFCGLMLLRFNSSPDDTSNFVSLNTLRNKVAAHAGGAATNITSVEVMKLLRQINLAFQKI